MALSDLDDALRHGGGEHHRLTILGRRGEDRVDVLGESHVEHFVGFVKDDGVDVIELQVPALNQIHGATGVATTTSTPRLRAATWRPIGWPPKTGNVRTPYGRP